MKRKEKAARSASAKKKAAAYGGAALAAILVLSRFSTPTNVAETSADDTDARMHPRVFKHTPARVSQEIGILVPQLRTYGKRWKANIASTREQNILRAEVPVLVFTDDLTVTLSPQNGGASTRVEVRSASRVGKSDFGENRRHIVQFLTALDARFE